MFPTAYHGKTMLFHRSGQRMNSKVLIALMSVILASMADDYTLTPCEEDMNEWKKEDNGWLCFLEKEGMAKSLIGDYAFNGAQRERTVGILEQLCNYP